MAEKYNGWTNYATWAIYTEMANDESTHNYALSLVSHLFVDDTPGEVLKSWWVSATLGDGLEEMSAVERYAEAFLDQVNWDEIGAAYYERTEPDDGP